MWNLRVAKLLGPEGTGGERAAEALARARLLCAGAHSRMPDTFQIHFTYISHTSHIHFTIVSDTYKIHVR